MLVLAIDSSTMVAGVAVVSDDRLLMESFLNTGKTHSQRLMPMLDAVLQAADLSLADIDALAVSIGPGSFTGLRIGLATVKGLAQAANKPIIGVPTLDALVMNAAGLPGLICPILDARKNEVYTAVYKFTSTLEFKRLTDYMAISPIELMDLLSNSSFEQDNVGGNSVTFLGDGVPVHQKLLSEGLGQRVQWVLPTHNLIRAGQIAYLGAKKLKAGLKEDYLNIKPVYIRQSEAEVKWQQQKQGQ